MIRVKILRDLTLPLPLLDPSKWRMAWRPDEVAVVDLETLVSVGGPLRDFYFEILNREDNLLRVRLGCFKRASAFGLREQARDLLLRFQRNFILLENGSSEDFSADLSAGFRLVFDFQGSARFFSQEGILVPKAPSIEAWLEAIDPVFFESAQEPLRKYKSEMGEEVIDSPFTALRFFGGFLRRRGDAEWAISFQKQWSRVQAWFSPQNELQPLGSDFSGEMILNPTLQIVRGLKNQVDIYWRSRGELLERSLEIREAAFLDELGENGRLTRDGLVAAAEHILGQNSESLLRTLEKLLREGIVLTGASSAVGRAESFESPAH